MKSASIEWPFDDFVIEGWNPTSHRQRFIVEFDLGATSLFRASFDFDRGPNIVRFSSRDIGLGKRTKGLIRIFPENDAEHHVIFTWLTFVRYRRDIQAATSDATPPGPNQSPDKKVKCVVWDLDNTLWHGVLIEDGANGIKVDIEVENTIRELDRRGVLQSVSSKNELEETWRTLTELGLAKYFLYPAINWGPKSVNIREIARKLSLDLDTFMFIDDSPFEQAEVKQNLPQVRVIDARLASGLLVRPDLDLPVTEESRGRRHMYMVDAQRQAISVGYTDDYVQFLRDCEMSASLFHPTESKHVDRCVELLGRTNQLNLAGRRYSRDELLLILRDEANWCIAVSCSDRFGEYGIIGFAGFTFHNNRPSLFDYTMSCRIAKKKLENALFSFVLNRLRLAGASELQTKPNRTDRNGILIEVLTEIGFEPIPGGLLKICTDSEVPDSDVARISGERLTDFPMCP